MYVFVENKENIDTFCLKTKACQELCILLVFILVVFHGINMNLIGATYICASKLSSHAS